MSEFNRQFQAAARQYDNASPPEGIPDWMEQDATASVALALHKAGEVDELVSVVANAESLLLWVADQGVPPHLGEAFRELDRKARNLRKSVDEQIERAA